VAARSWLRWLTHLAALTPLALLIWDGTHNRLTANPIQEITLRTGKTALVLLVLSLACTPLNRLLGLRQVVPLRRPLGLYAYFYAGLHLLTFVVIDYGLDFGLIQQAVVEKRYVLAGLAAFLLLTPLAITSTKGWMRRLGRRWKVVHRLIYLAVPLVILHYAWLSKGDVLRFSGDIRQPLLYGAAVALLLALRLPRKRFPPLPWGRGGREVRGVTPE
jgi:sulfoxide reductase heme-binding subunit YedZ